MRSTKRSQFRTNTARDRSSNRVCSARYATVATVPSVIPWRSRRRSAHARVPPQAAVRAGHRQGRDLQHDDRHDRLHEHGPVSFRTVLEAQEIRAVVGDDDQHRVAQHRGHLPLERKILHQPDGRRPGGVGLGRTTSTRFSWTPRRARATRSSGRRPRSCPDVRAIREERDPSRHDRQPEENGEGAALADAERDQPVRGVVAAALRHRPPAERAA